MNLSNEADSVVDYRAIGELPPAALGLFEAAERLYPEFSAAWFANLQQTVFREDPGVRYHVSFRSGEPQAILPVRTLRRGLARRLEALGNYYTSLYSPILGPDATAEDLAALLESASSNSGVVDEMCFAPLNPASPAYPMLLSALRKTGWIPFEYRCFNNWYLQVEGGYGDYLKSRKGSLRSTIKRMNKKFADRGGAVEIVATPELAEQGLRDYVDVYGRSWKQPEPYPGFVPGLIRLLAEKGSLRLGIARIAGQPIAAQLWLTSHGKASIFKVAYDEAFAEFSPGTLLASHLMEHVIDCDKVREVDFLTGEDEYKKHWMSHQRERRGIVAYTPRTPMGLALLGRKYLARLLHKAEAAHRA